MFRRENLLNILEAAAVLVGLIALRQVGAAMFQREARGMMLLAVIMPVISIVLALIGPFLIRLLTGH